MTTALSAPAQTAPAPARPAGPFLDLDRDTFLPRFNAQSCLVRHRLTDHPLFDLRELLALAKRLPAKYVRINNGRAPVNATPDQIPGARLTVEESFERIGENETRIMLKGIEHDPVYGALLRECLGEIEALGHPASRGVWAREGYVFISAPNMVTPYHMDPEINWLLQVRGKKTFHVLSAEDRGVLSEEDVELFYAGRHKALTFKEEAKARAAVFDLSPGEGVHIPVNHPHWVQTYDEVTISFALTMQTAATKRRGAIYAVNHALRQRGLSPTPYGRSALRDFLKFQAFRLGQALSRLRPGARAAETHHY
jgi:hypothetical protein